MSLLDAVAAGDMAQVNKLLASGVDVNTVYKTYYTALVGAVYHNKLDIMKHLLTVPGIDVNLCKPLRLAIRNKNIEAIKLLLKDRRVNVNLQDYLNNAPIFESIINGFTKGVSLLLKHPDIDVTLTSTDHFHQGDSVLEVAVSMNRLNVLKKLLADPRVDVNKGNPRHNNTPLTLAVWTGPSDIVEELLKAPGIDVNKPGRNGNTPLHKALHIGVMSSPELESEVVPLLLNAPGIDINKTNNDGNTPLHIAVHQGNLEIVRLLLDAGADLGIRNNGGKRAEDIAIEKGRLEMARMISEKYAANAWRRRGHAVTAFGIERARENGDSSNEMPTLEHTPRGNHNGRRRHRKTQRRSGRRANTRKLRK